MWFSRSTPAVVPRGPSVAVPVVVAGDTERRRFCHVGSLGFDSLSHKRFMCTVSASLLRNPEKKILTGPTLYVILRYLTFA